ncbi:hypothetical protein ACHAW6_001078 [Cyclotella cf. meneghiniana]
MVRSVRAMNYKNTMIRLSDSKPNNPHDVRHDASNKPRTRNPLLKSLSSPGRLFSGTGRPTANAGGTEKFFERIPEVFHEFRFCQMLSRSTEQAFVDRKYQIAAHTLSIRQNAGIMVAWVLFFFAVSIAFFVHAGNLTVPDAMLFTVYTVTTAGFGSIRIPHTTGFLVAVIVFVYLGLASVTILAATLYQYTSWKSSSSKQHRSASDLSVIQRAKNIFRSSEIARAAITASYLLLLLLTGTIVMMFLENWNLAEAFYFATYVMTTVGYGAPVAPKTSAGTLFCVFWVPFNVSFLSIYMGNLGRYYCMITGWNTRRIQKELHRR